VKAADAHRPLRQHVEAVDFNSGEEVSDHRLRLPRPAAGGREPTASRRIALYATVAARFHRHPGWHRGGSPERSKAYTRSGLQPPRTTAWWTEGAIENLAARHSFIDIERVGIYGPLGAAGSCRPRRYCRSRQRVLQGAVGQPREPRQQHLQRHCSETYHGLKGSADRRQDQHDHRRRPARWATDWLRREGRRVRREGHRPQEGRCRG